MVIVLLIIAIVFSALSVVMNLGKDGGFVERFTTIEKTNSGPSVSGVQVNVLPNGVNSLVLGVLNGF